MKYIILINLFLGSVSKVKLKIRGEKEKYFFSEK
jgi:hypothetical protein